ncbi:MAG: hypothetical protein IKE11_06485 [Clostridia bacterium]|nr:hypothetical protein [Clostridia bacterium]
MKKMIVNCASCDMRTVSEETLQSYEQIVVNSALVLVTPRTKELLNRYSVMLNTADMMEVPEGDNVRLNSQNGSYELTSDGMPEAGVIALLMVNGSLTVGEDALEAARAYHSIKVNGSVMLPKSMAGKLSNLSVNGSIKTYPDGAIRLRRNAIIDKTFPLRIRENALYWAARRLVFTDPALDVEKLRAMGVRFSAKTALIAESLAEAVTPLLTDDTDITVVPDGTIFVNDDVKMDRRFLKKHGPRAYINGDLTVEPDAVDILPEIRYLYVNGDVKLPQELVEAFEDVDARYDELEILKKTGKIIQDQVRAAVDKVLLEKFPDGVIVRDCAMLKISADVPPELILERLSISDCAKVVCTEEQEAAVSAIAEDVAMIGGMGDAMDGIADMVTGSLGLNPDLKVVNAAEYVM